MNDIRDRLALNSLRRAAALLLIVLSLPANAGTVHVPQSASYRLCTWKYWKGTAEPAAGWRELTFDDTAWLAGMAPFGYGARGYVRYGTQLDDMRQGYSTLFLRKRFFVDDLAQTRALKLSINCHDGFVAWINGTKVAERHAPERPMASSLATAGHAASEFHLYEVIPIANTPLRAGYNVLAIQLIGASHDNPMAHFDASLVDTWNLAFNRPTKASSTYRGARNIQPYTAVDGTRLTFWSSSKPPAGEEWVAVDLGQLQPIDKVRLAWWGGERPAPSGPKDFQVQVSAGNHEWKTVATATERKAGEDEITFAPVTVRHVRIFMTAGHGNAYALLDLEVYAPGVLFDPRECDSLAFGKPTKASSLGASRSWPASKVVDANPIGSWLSKKGTPDPQWLEIDLEATRRIAGVKLYFGENHASRFTVRVASAPDQWRNVDYAIDTEEIPAGDVHRVHRLVFSAIEAARYVRLDLWEAVPHPDHFVVHEFMVIGVPTAQPEK